MKRDIKKIELIKEGIRRFYLTVSDRKIAERFGVSERSVAVARLRMGLKKDKAVVEKLKRKARVLAE